MKKTCRLLTGLGCAMAMVMAVLAPTTAVQAACVDYPYPIFHDGTNHTSLYEFWNTYYADVMANIDSYTKDELAHALTDMCPDRVFQMGPNEYVLLRSGVKGIEGIDSDRYYDVYTDDGDTMMYRLYNPNSGEHFYTASTEERDGLKAVGWNYEGIGWIAPASSNTPVYRLYNPNSGDHHYTVSEEEKSNLVSVGWNDEGIGWYSDDNCTIPLYRQYNPNADAGSHNYTINSSENDSLVAAGWNAEGIGWYGCHGTLEMQRDIATENWNAGIEMFCDPVTGLFIGSEEEGLSLDYYYLLESDLDKVVAGVTGVTIF